MTSQLKYFMESFVILSRIMDGEIVYSLLFVCHLICLVVQSGDYNTLSCMLPVFNSYVFIVLQKGKLVVVLEEWIQRNPLIKQSIST